MVGIMSIEDNKVICFTEYIKAKRDSEQKNKDLVPSAQDGASLVDNKELLRALFLDVTQEPDNMKPARKSDTSGKAFSAHEITSLIQSVKSLVGSIAQLLNSLHAHSVLKKI